MYKRKLSPILQSAAKQYPVVTLIGPRQSGKTTLAKHEFPNKTYVNLEPLDTRRIAEQDPRQFLSQLQGGAIIDEIQHVPQLLSYIQTIVDEHDIPGEFILTGSHQVALHEAIAQSLAGRTAVLKLLPLSQIELQDANIVTTLDQGVWMGGFPRLYTRDIEPPSFYRDYCQTYVEKDVRSIINVKNLMQFQKFMRLCASRIGQLLVYSSLAADLGVSTQTVKEWLSILEASFLAFQLPPYFENFGKRLIKSPKLYFYDTGLAAYLIDIETQVQMNRDPLRGSYIENLIILEMIKWRMNSGRDPHLYFYRDSHGNEVDLIYKTGEYLIPIEIKSSETFHIEFLKGLKFFKSLVKQRAPKGYLVYTGEKEFEIEGFQVINYKNVTRIFEAYDGR